MSCKKMILRLLTVIVGTVIAAFGLDIAIYAGFGSATLAVLWQGMAKTIRITIGQASLIIAAAMVVFCWFYMTPEHRKYLNYNESEFTSWGSSIGEHTASVVRYFLTSGKETEQGYLNDIERRGNASKSYGGHIPTSRKLRSGSAERHSRRWSVLCSLFAA